MAALKTALSVDISLLSALLTLSPPLFIAFNRVGSCAISSTKPKDCTTMTATRSCMSQVVALLDMNLNRDKERKHTVVAAAAGPVRQEQMAAFFDFWKITLIA